MIQDPFTKTETEKAAFYRPGEEWRDLRPEGFKPATAETLRAEAKERRRIHELNASLEQVCMVCLAAIPAHEPDYILVNEKTDERWQCCIRCEPPRWTFDYSAKFRVKYRPGLAGEELSEDEYRARVAHVKQSGVVENDTEEE